MVAADGPIQRKTREAAARVLAPKLQGALVLDRLFGDTPLDFLVLCSSLGGFGRVADCAANAFLDAFAHARRTTWLRRPDISFWPSPSESSALDSGPRSSRPSTRSPSDSGCSATSPATTPVLRRMMTTNPSLTANSGSGNPASRQRRIMSRVPVPMRSM